MGGAGTKTIAAVIEARDRALREISESAMSLQARAESIKDKAFTAPLDASDIAELQEISAAQGALAAAQIDLAVATMISLNEAAEVKRLVSVVEAANADLKAKLKKVQSVAETVKNVGDLLKSITTVIQNLSKLAALF